MINPLIWQDPEFGGLNDREKLLFIGCLSNADDEGRLRGHSSLLRAMIFPYGDVSIEEIEETKNQVAKKMKNFILYKIGENEFIQFAKWNEHQTIRPDRMTKSIFPLPTNTNTEEPKIINIRTNISFEDFWNLYDKKAGLKIKIEKKWNKLTDKERQDIMNYIPKYIGSQPEKRFRKNPETFLNNRSWEDEIISSEKPKIKKAFFHGEPMYFDKIKKKWFVIVDNEFLSFEGKEEDIEWKLI